MPFLHKLDSRYVLKFFDWYESSNHIWLILEYCMGGDLLNLITQDKQLPESVVKVVILLLRRSLSIVVWRNMEMIGVVCNFVVIWKWTCGWTAISARQQHLILWFETGKYSYWWVWVFEGTWLLWLASWDKIKTAVTHTVNCWWNVSWRTLDLPDAFLESNHHRLSQYETRWNIWSFLLIKYFDLHCVW